MKIEIENLPIEFENLDIETRYSVSDCGNGLFMFLSENVYTRERYFEKICFFEEAVERFNEAKNF